MVRNTTKSILFQMYTEQIIANMPSNFEWVDKVWFK